MNISYCLHKTGFGLRALESKNAWHARLRMNLPFFNTHLKALHNTFMLLEIIASIFICNLFSGGLLVIYKITYRLMNDKLMMNWKVFGRKRLCHNFKVLAWHSPKKHFWSHPRHRSVEEVQWRIVPTIRRTRNCEVDKICKTWMGWTYSTYEGEWPS
jgi:hypothetical protein